MKVQLLSEHAKLPVKKRIGDAGFDLFSPIDFTLEARERFQVKLGIAIEINENEVAIISERSGHALNNGITTIGNIIDSNYRGEISAILYNSGFEKVEFKIGDRIAQVIITRLGDQSIQQVNELSDNLERGTNGYGSSGNK